MAEVNCYCGEKVEFDIPEGIDLDNDKEIRAAILDGLFMAKNCPACDKILKPELAITFLYDQKKKRLAFIPELERGAFLTGQGSYEGEEIVIGYPELVEWIRIREANLNRNAIEIIKYYLLKKADKRETLNLFYNEIQENNLIFHIYGLKPDEIGITRIPMDSYDKIILDLPRLKEQDPFCYFLSEPYISVSRVYWDQEV